MRLFLGILIGLLLAIGIAVGAGYMAFGDLKDVGNRDRSADISQTYDLTGFDEIDIGGVYELDVTVGGEFSVEVSGHPDEMERAEVAVEGSVLRLSQKDERFGKRNWRNKGLTAVVTLPALMSLDVAGVADAEITGVEAEAFSVSLSGVGDVVVSGSCTDLTARVSGVGSLDASDLKCEDVDVTVSGVGDAKVYASRSVDASVGGIGSISVYGSPSQVEKSGGFLSDIDIR